MGVPALADHGVLIRQQSGHWGSSKHLLWSTAQECQWLLSWFLLRHQRSSSSSLHSAIALFAHLNCLLLPENSTILHNHDSGSSSVNNWKIRAFQIWEMGVQWLTIFEDGLVNKTLVESFWYGRNLYLQWYNKPIRTWFMGKEKLNRLSDNFQFQFNIVKSKTKSEPYTFISTSFPSKHIHKELRWTTLNFLRN